MGETIAQIAGKTEQIGLFVAYFSCEIAKDARERASNVVLIELLDVHHRSVILSAEPFAALPHFRSADVDAIATGVSRPVP